MKKVLRLTESQLISLVRNIINEVDMEIDVVNFPEEKTVYGLWRYSKSELEYFKKVMELFFEDEEQLYQIFTPKQVSDKHFFNLRVTLDFYDKVFPNKLFRGLWEMLRRCYVEGINPANAVDILFKYGKQQSNIEKLMK